MSTGKRRTANEDWVQIRRDPDTGIESVHAHFRGHAYDPHDHDEVLVGITHQGVQRFRCHRSVHTSTPGRAMLIEPGAVHDGHAPEDVGFTYGMLYLPQAWVASMMQRLGQWDASAILPAFRNTLTDDALLSKAIQQAFLAIHQSEGRLARDQSLDRMMGLMSTHLHTRAPLDSNDSAAQLGRAQEFLHAQMGRDIGLDELASHSGIDRFRLSRQFSRSFGLSPHAYLVRLRLRKARALLAGGQDPAQVALEVGFADQSHMGRWFQRAYRITPAAYRRHCTNVLD
ncbi:AraC family transcriptional regulator [Pigmentiphaga aceris]|uniref:AraC family transcriptional regulator n=1 Tax=Pigmentiphaga aceris TaxID=1940612 RepID=A0A5C0AYW3_9BURK|nr:AraC family transcriptional regulator [Pigmentiphaga aceris]QEI06603.1 AraC family transcriptional regulator [Pigmentiphaga aceris]